jgi:hypothetical protein
MLEVAQEGRSFPASVSVMKRFPGVLCAGLGICLCLALLAGGCRQTDPPEGPSPWLEEVTAQVGLDFVHDPGPLGTYFMPQSLGSGAALFDFDNDGRLDIYLLQNGGPQGQRNRLYRQLPDGRFQDVSAGSGLDIAGYNMGVAIGDVNNDGWPDVLVTQYGGVRLFLNNGDGRSFTDITEEAGLSNPAWGASAAFVDLDRDGWLDLVVVNYVDYDPTWPCTGPNGAPDYCPPRTFPGRVTRVFRNLGPQPGARHGVRFADITATCGVGKAAGPGLGVICADFDGDGWPDIFVANDGAANHLWINQRNGTFREEALVRGLAYNGMGVAEAGMGVALGDVDGDGLFDLFVTHLTEEMHTLWRQGPRGLFCDGTAASGLAAPDSRGTGFGTALLDLNQDGWLDAVVVQGRVSRNTRPQNPALGPHWSWYAERNRLFANRGQGHFEDISAANPDFCGTPNVARGLAWGDVDGDGALDLLVTTAGGRARLYRNVAPQRGHWLLVRALDPRLRRDAYGAEVRVFAGHRRWWRLVSPAGSYLCSSDVRAHFGLGEVTHIERLEVLWPDGLREEFPGGPVDRLLELRRGSGRPLPEAPGAGRPHRSQNK